MPSPTRFAGLAFRKVDRHTWMFVDTSDGSSAQIGPQYRSKAELLACVETFAIERGYTAAPMIHSPKDCRPQGQPRLSPAEIRRRNLESLSDAFLKARTALEHNLSIAEASADATYLECEIDRARALLKLAHR